MKKCFFCGKKYEESDAFIGFDGFVHCPHCHSPLFDPKIQSADHWCWKYMPDDKENDTAICSEEAESLRLAKKKAFKKYREIIGRL